MVTFKNNDKEIIEKEKKRLREKSFREIEKLKKEQKDIYKKYDKYKRVVSVPESYAQKYPNIYEETK